MRSEWRRQQDRGCQGIPSQKGSAAEGAAWGLTQPLLVRGDHFASGLRHFDRTSRKKTNAIVLCALLLLQAEHCQLGACQHSTFL